MRNKERAKPYSHGHRHGTDIDPAFRGGLCGRRKPAAKWEVLEEPKLGQDGEANQKKG